MHILTALFCISVFILLQIYIIFRWNNSPRKRKPVNTTSKQTRDDRFITAKTPAKLDKRDFIVLKDLLEQTSDIDWPEQLDEPSFKSFLDSKTTDAEPRRRKITTPVTIKDVTYEYFTSNQKTSEKFYHRK